ncbi:MAG: TatD family hydrolase [Candidatus Acidiferrales bacterium]
MEIIDSHAHLEFPQFDTDREEMLARAREAGVTTLLAIGSGTASDRLDAAIPFAEKYDWIYGTVGVHPHESKLATDEWYEELSRLAKHPRVIAWGEIGLDYFYDHSPRDVQRNVFQRQLELARTAKLPVIIHCRDAWPECLEILEKDLRSSGMGGVFHCFTGTLAEARQGIEMGFVISFSANITYPKMGALRDVAAALPLENILVETDSPFLPPQRIRGKRNEPAFVVEVAQTLANVRNLAADEVARATAENFRRFFHLADRQVAGGHLADRVERSTHP